MPEKAGKRTTECEITELVPNSRIRWKAHPLPIGMGVYARLAFDLVSVDGYAVSGRATIRLDDGSQQSIQAGQSYTIPSGHDAWVEGDEPFVTIELMSAEQFAKPQT